MGKKKLMKVSMASKFVTGSGRYTVHWGSTSSAFNKQSRSFKVRRDAVKFKDGLVKRFKKSGYKVDYKYLVD